MSRHPFQWPSDLYLEFRYMGQAVFLSQVFDSLCQQARAQVLEGLAVDPATGQLSMRQITAEQAYRVVTENQDILTLPLNNVEQVRTQLQALVQIAPGAKSLVAWDDDDLKRGLTYVIAKDDNDKRITLVFLNTPTDIIDLGGVLGAPQTQLNLHSKQPAEGDSTMAEPIGMHAALYRYLMESNDDGGTESKYMQIYQQLKSLTKSYPKYKYYVTGQAGAVSTGLAQCMAFFLASDASTPKPVSCLVMGSTPRVGNGGFLQATQALEQERFLRVCRMHHVSDDMVGPLLPDYQHVGFQIKLLPKPPPSPSSTKEEDKQPLVLSPKSAAAAAHAAMLTTNVTYPKVQDTCWNRFTRAWDNRWKLLLLLTSSQPCGSDHDYLEWLDQAQHQLQALDLNELYSEQNVTGYLIVPLPVEK